MIPGRSITHGKFTFDYLTPNIWAEFQEWAVSQGVGFGADPLFDFASSPMGARWLLWRCVSRAHPELQIEEVGNLFDGIPEMVELVGKLADPTQAGAIIGKLSSG